MKKTKKSIIVLCILCIMSIIASVTVYAKDAPPKNVEIKGGAKELVHVPNDKVFLSNLNMIPGSFTSGKIKINNTEDIGFRLILCAENVTDGEYVKDKYINLLDHINFIIKYNGKEIYKGPASKQQDNIDGIDLGVYKPGEEGEIEAYAELDDSIGNEYKNKYGEIKWIFTAIADEESVNDENNYFSKPTIINRISKIYKTSDPLLVFFSLVFIASFVTIIYKIIRIKRKGECV